MELFWFVYTPGFIGASIIGSLVGYLLMMRLHKFSLIQQTIDLFQKREQKNMRKYQKFGEAVFPLKKSPLVHCLTNEVTAALLANSILSIQASPFMADAVDEVEGITRYSSSCLINLGHLFNTRCQAMFKTANLSLNLKRPWVMDLVGIGATKVKSNFAQELMAFNPDVVKGNVSELRCFCELGSKARGIDSDHNYNSPENLQILAEALQKLSQIYPNTVFLATGSIDLISSQNKVWKFNNGVAELGMFTGTGDIVGALIAALLGEGLSGLNATIIGLTYFNRCGEVAYQQWQKTEGLTTIRHRTLDQISILWHKKDWAKEMIGVRLC